MQASLRHWLEQHGVPRGHVPAYEEARAIIKDGRAGPVLAWELDQTLDAAMRQGWTTRELGDLKSMGDVLVRFERQPMPPKLNTFGGRTPTPSHLRAPTPTEYFQSGRSATSSSSARTTVPVSAWGPASPAPVPTPPSVAPFPAAANVSDRYPGKHENWKKFARRVAHCTCTGRRRKPTATDGRSAYGLLGGLSTVAGMMVVKLFGPVAVLAVVLGAVATGAFASALVLRLRCDSCGLITRPFKSERRQLNRQRYKFLAIALMSGYGAYLCASLFIWAVTASEPY